MQYISLFYDEVRSRVIRRLADMQVGDNALERSDAVTSGANSYSPIRQSSSARGKGDLSCGNDPVNAMTVDVEDYFQVSAFDPHIKRSDWDGIATRVEKNVEKILKIFDEAGIVGTFFILGWIAQKHPELVRKIAQSGHEIASHGWHHRRVSQQSPE